MNLYVMDQDEALYQTMQSPFDIGAILLKIHL